MLSPFPIFDMRSGLDISKEPWISPPDAWRELENCYVHRGRIIRRGGYTLFGELGYVVTAEATGDGNAKGTSGAPYNDTLTNSPVVPAKAGSGGTLYGRVTIEDTSTHTGANAVMDDGNGNLVHAVDGTVGSINYSTGAFTVNGLSVAFDSNVTVDYEYRKDTANAVMGIESHFPAAGGENLLAMDRFRYWKYDSTEMRFKAPAAVVQNLWSGSDADFMFSDMADDKLLVANGVDPVYYYNGTAFAEVHTDFDNPTGTPANPETGGAAGGGYSRNVDSAQMVFFHKNRIILLHTLEGSIRYGQRARWSEVDPSLAQSYLADGSDYIWRAADYKDAPTVDQIVSASLLGDDLVVFFERSVWRLTWTNDFRTPFEWEQIAPTDGSFAKMSTVDFTDELLSLGPTSMVATDGNEVYSIDDAMPDRVLDMNPEKLLYSFSIVAEDKRLVLWTFADAAEDYPNKMLTHQYETKSWAEWSLAMHCLGYYEFAEGLTWDDVTDKYGAIEHPFDMRTSKAGFPAVLGGDRICKVWRLFDGLEDDGTPYTMRMSGQRLNPYKDQGGAGAANARLGQLDIIATAATDVVLTVRLYENFENSAYQTYTMDLTPSEVSDKVKRTVVVNRSALAHRVEIEYTGSSFVAIEAIIPWFEPDGEIREVA